MKSVGVDVTQSVVDEGQMVVKSESTPALAFHHDQNNWVRWIVKSCSGEKK